MSSFQDLSTWRLKRRYIRHIKRMWSKQRWDTLTSMDRALRASYQSELMHRGWSV